LKAKAMRIFDMIKNTIQYEIPIQIWLKIRIKQIALFAVRYRDP